mmetsp:Transcript_24769/g.68306  ORF Transcript_24769/g.68306 Transcript_24769/m.68306 type:complete len:115 (-) Transcript_24769:722-1066(-)
MSMWVQTSSTIANSAAKKIDLTEASIKRLQIQWEADSTHTPIKTMVVEEVAPGMNGLKKIHFLLTRHNITLKTTTTITITAIHSSTTTNTKWVRDGASRKNSENNHSTMTQLFR